MSRLSENLINPGTGTNSPQTVPEFTREQRRFLLALARGAIASGLLGKSLQNAPPAFGSWPGLMEPRGAFTTLYIGDQLRGCVGYAMPIRPLYLAVSETARAAAFEDSRFYPVTAEEAPQLRVSLSVLSPLVPISAGQVEVGRHGLVISDGMRRGLLLPQVPVEHGWDRDLSQGRPVQRRVAGVGDHRGFHRRGIWGRRHS